MNGCIPVIHETDNGEFVVYSVKNIIVIASFMDFIHLIHRASCYNLLLFFFLVNTLL